MERWNVFKCHSITLSCFAREPENTRNTRTPREKKAFTLFSVSRNLLLLLCICTFLVLPPASSSLPPSMPPCLSVWTRDPRPAVLSHAFPFSRESRKVALKLSRVSTLSCRSIHATLLLLCFPFAFRPPASAHSSLIHFLFPFRQPSCATQLLPYARQLLGRLSLSLVFHSCFSSCS